MLSFDLMLAVYVSEKCGIYDICLKQIMNEIKREKENEGERKKARRREA